MDLEHRTAVVTGASKGTGAAITAHLRAAGATVVGTARTAPPDAGLFVAADLTTPEGIAAVRLDRALLPLMTERRSGSVIHVSSIQRRMPLHEATLGYAAAKAALTTYSKGLANEVAEYGIRVNVVSPGAIRTTAADQLAERVAAGRGITPEAAWQHILDSLGGVPLNRADRRLRSSHVA
jgi:NAD(P)-dependent dehydrogenase (short-subunit alcohol dehydrogenase family)